MTLAALVFVLLAGGLVAWVVGVRRPEAARWISLGALGLDLLLALGLALRATPGDGRWLAVFDRPWIESLGIRFHLAADGIALLLILLTLGLGVIAVGCSWTEIRRRVGFFHGNLLWILGGVVGVFLARDLFLFYFFWELMLIPMVFLIGIWGHERRIYAAVKFFLFTQASGLLMLLAILTLYVFHGRQSRIFTFDADALLGTSLAPSTALWVMLGFFVAFAVKLPVVPFHTWLPDAHAEAPTAGSVILAGLLLKTGGFGILRFALPLLPETGAAGELFAAVALGLGALGVLYGAILAFAQTDLKRLVAYTSVSHLGFVLLGLYAGNALALQGAVLQMICHGLSTGALFVLVGQLQERTGTRDLSELGGLAQAVPRLGGWGIFFAMASLGLPGLGNFVAEFLILYGTWQVSIPATVAAALGLVLATAYSLRLVQRTFHGEDPQEPRELPDLDLRETALLGAMALVLLWLGLYPQPALDRASPGVAQTLEVVRAETVEEAP